MIGSQKTGRHPNGDMEGLRWSNYINDGMYFNKCHICLHICSSRDGIFNKCVNTCIEVVEEHQIPRNARHVIRLRYSMMAVLQTWSSSVLTVINVSTSKFKIWYEFGYVLDSDVQGWACCLHIFINEPCCCHRHCLAIFWETLCTEPLCWQRAVYLTTNHTHIPGKCLIRTWARPLMTCAVKPDWLNDFFSMHQNLPVNEPVLTHERQPISRCTNTKDIQTHVKRIEGKKLRQKRHSSGPFNEPTVEPKIWLTHFFPVSECWLQGMQCYSDSIKNCVGPYQGTAKTRSCDRPITDSGWGVRNPSVVLEFLGFLRLMSSSVDSMSLFLHENILPHAITLAVSLSHKDWFPWLSDYEGKTTYDYYRDQYHHHHHHDYYYYYYY